MLVYELVSVSIFVIIFIAVSILPAEVAELLVLGSGDGLPAFSLLSRKCFLLLDVLRKSLEILLLAKVLIIASGCDERFQMGLPNLSVFLLGGLVGEAAAAFSKASSSMVLLPSRESGGFFIFMNLA